MKKRIDILRASLLRRIYRKRLLKLHLDAEPKLFYGVVLHLHVGCSGQEYIYVGHKLFLPTNKHRKRNHFMIITL